MATEHSLIQSMGIVADTIGRHRLDITLLYGLRDNPNDLTTVAWNTLAPVMGPVWDDFNALLGYWGWAWQNQPVSDRLTWEDFEHDGSFTLKDGNNWQWVQQGGIAVWEDGSLVVHGKGWWSVDPASGSIGTGGTNVQQLMASVCPEPPNGWNFGGMCYDPASRKIWASLKAFYNTSGKDLASICAVDPANWSNVMGAWRVGPVGDRWSCAEIGGRYDCAHWIEPKNFLIYHANKTHGWITRIGPSFRERMNLTQTLAGGRQRGAGAFGGAQGPCLYGFVTDTNRSYGEHLDGIPLMAYPTDAGYWPTYTNSSSYRVEWVETPEGRGVILVFAVEGTVGNDVYGPGPACKPARGWHSHPYHLRIYLIDPEEIAKVLRGEQRPWHVKPFQTVEHPSWCWYGPTFPNCVHGAFEGTAWDDVNRTLYVMESKIGFPDEDNWCAIHKFKVTA